MRTVLLAALAATFMLAAPVAAENAKPAPPTAQEKPAQTCAKVTAKTFNRWLKKRQSYTGKRPKFKREPVCVRPHLRKLQAQVKKYRRQLTTNPFVAIPKAFRDAGIPWRIGEAMRVARCESHFNRFARNSGGYSGLFQLSYAHQARMRGHWTNAYDNAYHAAITVRADGGWRQWECKP